MFAKEVRSQYKICIRSVNFKSDIKANCPFLKALFYDSKNSFKYFLFNTKELAYSGKEHLFFKNNMIEFGSTVLKTARLKRVSGGIYEKLASSNCRK